MPYYDYRCQNCGRKVVIFYKTYADFDQATATCAHCGSTELTRLISRVAFGKSEEGRLENLTEADILSNIDENDPRSIGRFMRQMSREMGEDLGEEFGEVVERLEKGQAPEEIEKAMPNLADDQTDSAALGASELE